MCSIKNEYIINDAYILKKALELASEILCTTDISHLSLTQVKGGITNLIYLVENLKTNNKVLVRIYGAKTDCVINRKREVEICKLLSQAGLSKKIYGYFKEGQVEEWIEGNSLSEDTIKKSNIMKGIAETMKRLHSIPLTDEFYTKNESATYSPRSYKGKSLLFITIKMFFNKLMIKIDDIKKNFPNLDLEQIEHDIDALELICDKKKSPTVLCHGDLLPPNIIQTSDGIRFIDFEYSCPMERGFDIANHLMEYTGFQVDMSRFPTNEEESEFLGYYLGTNMKSDINALKSEISPFYLASNLFWGVWSLLQHYYSNVDFKYGEYAQKKLGLFMSKEQRRKYGWATA